MEVGSSKFDREIDWLVQNRHTEAIEWAEPDDKGSGLVIVRQSVHEAIEQARRRMEGRHALSDHDLLVHAMVTHWAQAVNKCPIPETPQSDDLVPGW